jgi:hypothetical protein
MGTGSLFHGPGVALTTHTHLVLRLKNEWSYISTHPLGLHGLLLIKLHLTLHTRVRTILTHTPQYNYCFGHHPIILGFSKHRLVKIGSSDWDQLFLTICSIHSVQKYILSSVLQELVSVTESMANAQNATNCQKHLLVSSHKSSL